MSLLALQGQYTTVLCDGIEGKAVLEDNLIVTEDGCESISAGTPFEPKLMRLGPFAHPRCLKRGIIMRIVELTAYPVSAPVPPEHHHVSLGIGRMIKRDAVEPSVDSFLQRFLTLAWSHSLLI